jgi:hypothetical protein
MKRVAVNYVTFARDLQWMDYTLGSFRKHAKGFCNVDIIVPTTDSGLFGPLVERYSTPDCPVRIREFIEYPGKGFLHHLIMKCYADIFRPDATHILHMDPDALFSGPVTPDDYFVDDKPLLVVEKYSAIPINKEGDWQGRLKWKAVTEMALRFDCPYETMCRHPAIHKIETYRKVRDYIESVHGTPFTDFVLKQKNSFPQGFGEFNTLGAYAYEKMRDEYHFWDRGTLGVAGDPKSLVEQLRSYDGPHGGNNPAGIERAMK